MAPCWERSRARWLARQADLERAALRVISSVGWDRATVSVIARAAGRPTGAVYDHFRSKQELLQAAVRRGLADVHLESPAPGKDVPQPPPAPSPAHPTRDELA